MTTWFTADHHLGHNRILDYSKRPFSSIDEMDAELIKRWNERVKPNDLVYHLGDFTLGGYKAFDYYIKQLNGTIFFVPGGHDQRWLTKYGKTGSDTKFTVLERLSYIKVRELEFVLCHYPMVSWEKSNYGMIHLHGHSHGNIGCIGVSREGIGAKGGYRMDVGVDCNNFYPISYTDIINRLDAYEGIVKV